MKTTRVQFQSLENLVAFAKLFNWNSYLINTQTLTLAAPLSSTEVVLAVDKYGANVKAAIEK